MKTARNSAGLSLFAADVPSSFSSRLGAIFFRVRSFAPLLVIALALQLVWQGHDVQNPGNAALNVIGVLACVLGAAIRFVTIGLIPRGTSLQSRRLQAAALNTTGPYAVVRHPLYLGNFFITFGVLAVAHTLWGWVFGLSYVVLSQYFIVQAEDALLREKYGAQFDAWAREVSAFWPRLSKLRDVRGGFAWKRAVQREVNPLVAWGSGLTLLLLWETFASSQLEAAVGWRFVGVQVALLVLLIANKVWKKVSPA